MTGSRESSQDEPRPSARAEPGEAQTPSRPPPGEAIREVLDAYHEAFDAGDAREVSPYVHRPCTVVTRWGAYVLADRGEIVSAFSSVQRDLRARGCVRIERRDVRVRVLDDRLARARALSVRFRDDDGELDRTASTYVLRRTDEGWRIVVLVEHDPVDAPASA